MLPLLPITVTLTLRVLLTANHLFRSGGSETFTRTISRAFERRGDRVDVLTVEPGVYSLRSGLNVIDIPAREYDLVLVSHNSCLPKVSLCAGRKVFIAHGTFPELEQPHPGADRYSAVSEEVARHLAERGFEAKVIRNGVDLDVFKAAWEEQPATPARVLSLLQGDGAHAMLVGAAARIGAKVVRAQGLAEKDLVRAMSDSDVIVSLGRGVIEAMACGRAALVFDGRWYMNGQCLCDGFVTPDNWQKLAEFNFSGRATRNAVTVEALAEIMSGYRRTMGSENRSLAAMFFDASKKVNEYVEFAA